MISSLFILNRAGDVILEKHWASVQSRTAVDAFWLEMQNLGGLNAAPPVIEAAKTVFMFITRDSLVFLGAVARETSPLMSLEMMHRFADILKQVYFPSAPGLTEDLLRDNFVTVFSLLDEFADNGFPLTTEPATLKEVVPPHTGILSSLRSSSIVTATVPDSSLGVVSWRKSGIRYSTNEIFFDVIEEIDAIVDINGIMLSHEVQGRIECKCHLSGMPDVLVTFLDPTILDDCSFHPCVRYARYESDRSLSFIPPDGSFTLMTYRINRPANVPLYVKPQISFNSAGGRVTIMSGMRQSSNANIISVEDIVVTVPMPQSVASVTAQVQGGSFKFDQSSRVLKWDIGKMSGAKTCSLEATAKLSSSQVPDGSVTVQVAWKIPQICISGLKVDSVNISGERYKAFKGVRAYTKSGNFTIRT
eukprot:ANDGO_06642.mRNA.1 AP-3 complex subunit mu